MENETQAKRQRDEYAPRRFPTLTKLMMPPPKLPNDVPAEKIEGNVMFFNYRSALHVSKFVPVRHLNIYFPSAAHLIAFEKCRYFGEQSLCPVRIFFRRGVQGDTCYESEQSERST